MGYEATHKHYDKRLPEWEKIRDCMDGEEAIKNGPYLPQLSGHRYDEYLGYKDRAVWYGATSRTVQGLAAALMRKPPALELPAQLKELTNNITQTGITFQMFAKSVAEEVIAFARFGLLVDVATDGSEPYFAGYHSEQIRNWRTEIYQGKPRLVQVILKECVEVPGEDGFGVEEKEQYRVLSLENNVYVVDLYIEQDDGNYIRVRLTPVVRGRQLNYIPFLFINPFSLAAEPERPILLDLATINIHHYRISADWRHALYFTSLPQPWVSGITEEGMTWQIGSSRVMQLPVDAKAGMLEFTGHGIGALERAMEALEKRMAVLGARLLEDQNETGSETAEAVRARHTGENSTMGAIADTLGRAFETAFRWMAGWKGLNPGADEIKVRMNTDFIDAALTPQALLALVGSWQAGAIPNSVLWHNLRQGEIIPVDMTDDQIQGELETNPPLGVLAQQADIRATVTDMKQRQNNNGGAGISTGGKSPMSL